MNIDINSLTELSPPVLLMVGLNVLGWLVKQSSIPTRYVPLILPTIGGIVFPFIYDASNMILNVKSQTAVAVIMGVIIGGAAVGSHQALQALMSKTSTSSVDPK